MTVITDDDFDDFDDYNDFYESDYNPYRDSQTKSGLGKKIGGAIAGAIGGALLSGALGLLGGGDTDPFNDEGWS